MQAGAASSPAADPDRVFFRGFGGTAVAAADTAVARPTAPPRRRRSCRRRGGHLQRSLSLTAGELLTAARLQDQGQQGELYPDFPRSTPIYAVIDRSKECLAVLPLCWSARVKRPETEFQTGHCTPGAFLSQLSFPSRNSFITARAEK